MSNSGSCSSSSCGCFVVVAIPSSSITTTTSTSSSPITSSISGPTSSSSSSLLDEFRSHIISIIDENNNRNAKRKGDVDENDVSQSVHITLHDVTKVVDNDTNEETNMGDCYLLSLELKPKGTAVVYDSIIDLNKINIGQLLRNPHAEIWVNSCVALPLAPPYGWTIDRFLYENNNNDVVDDDTSALSSAPTTTSAAQRICSCLNEYGLVCVKGKKQVYYQNDTTTSTTDFYDTILTKLNDRINELELLINENHKHITLGETPFGFQEFTYRGLNRFELLFQKGMNAMEDETDDTINTNNPDEIYNLLKEYYEPQFSNIICEYLNVNSIHDLRLNISCVYSLQGSNDQEWHTDGNQYNNSNSTTTSDKPYGVCIFIPLIKLSEQVGYTRFWPKSHYNATQLLGLGNAADTCLQACVDGILPNVGDYIIYNYAGCWHKGIGWKTEKKTKEDADCSSSSPAPPTTTTTEDDVVEGSPPTTRKKIRPVIQFFYSHTWYKERKNYGTKSIYE